MTVTVLASLADGAGPLPKQGDKVVVHYSGFLATASFDPATAKKFDCSREKGHAFTFTVGVGKVIQGWDDAVKEMPKGSRRRLLISSGDAYGERGHPPVIPPNANLVFDVEVLNINETLVEEGMRIRREESARADKFLMMQDAERAAEAEKQQQQQPAGSGSSKRRKRDGSSSCSSSDSGSCSDSQSERKRRKKHKHKSHKTKSHKKEKREKSKKIKKEKKEKGRKEKKHIYKKRKRGSSGSD